VRECPKILKICQNTKFYMSFQKINMRSRYEKGDFLKQLYLTREISDSRKSEGARSGEYGGWGSSSQPNLAIFEKCVLAF
jgi:hypothetical protein